MSRTLWLQDDRTVMNTSNFEVFHNYTDRPIEVAAHTHDFYELLFFQSGHVDYTVEASTYALRPGDIVITSSLELHRPVIYPDRLYERFVVWIHPLFVYQLKELEGSWDAVLGCFNIATAEHNHVLHPDREVFAELIALLNKLIDLKDHPELMGAKILNNCYVTELLVRLNQLSWAQQQNESVTGSPSAWNDPLIAEIITYINGNLEQELTYDDLNARFKVSKFHLARRFKKVTGITLHQFILSKRLSRTKLLLLQGASPYKACLEVGFNDYSNFSKTFKHVFGLSPRQFVEVNRQSGRILR